MSDTCGTCEHWIPRRDEQANGLCQGGHQGTAFVPATLAACGAHLPRVLAKGPTMPDGDALSLPRIRGHERCAWDHFTTHWLRCNRCLGENLAKPGGFCHDGLRLIGLWRPWAARLTEANNA